MDNTKDIQSLLEIAKSQNFKINLSMIFAFVFVGIVTARRNKEKIKE